MKIPLANGICAYRWQCFNINKPCCHVMPEKGKDYVLCEHFIKKVKCPKCGKYKGTEHFTRRSTSTGIIETGFAICNECVRYRRRGKCMKRKKLLKLATMAHMQIQSMIKKDIELKEKLKELVEILEEEK